MTQRMRLSPSGPFLNDSTSGAPLPVGPGTPGRIWRAQGVQGSTTDVSAGIASINGLEMEVEMLAGLRYDVHCSLQMVGSGTTSQEVTVAIEASTDGGGSWQDLGLTRETSVHVGTAGGAAVFGESALQRAAGSDTIDRVRVRAEGPAAPSPFTQDGNSFLRIEEYTG
ncbi:MAG: hypothetical protein JSV86_18485 [Gemmatimonadota bacterium]|nr:MAG: hypothetical protein JSV86_18485 [Gemmatimonadota bacterium]